jgi:3-dehydrosphinganine reductase
MTGRHAVVTGGSSGIGLATAALLGRKGAHVTLLARTPDRLGAAVEMLTEQGIAARGLSVDVTDRQAVEHAMAEAVSVSGPCDVLVTSAGYARPGYFEELDSEVFRYTMDVDYFGTLWAIRSVLPSMIERRTGSIVGVSSMLGLIGFFGYTPYSPAKFAVRGLLESLRSEVHRYGIHVGCVYPPDVTTPQLEYENQFKPAETFAISGTVRALSPEDVAASILHGIEHRKFTMVPQLQSRILARVVSVFPGVMARYADHKIKGIGRG